MTHHALDDVAREAFERRAQRGRPRGAEEVYAAAGRSAPEYVPANDELPARRNHSKVVALAAAVVVAVALVVTGFAVSMDTSSSRDVATASNPDESDAPEVASTADDELEATIADGWVRFAGTPWRDDVKTPEEAWVRVSDDVMPPDFDPAEFRISVYDRKGGEVIGYNYFDLGYVPREITESGTFDAAQERIAKFGCDVRLDPVCREQHGEQLQAEIDRQVAEDQRREALEE